MAPGWARGCRATHFASKISRCEIPVRAGAAGRDWRGPGRPGRPGQQQGEASPRRAGPEGSSPSRESRPNTPGRSAIRSQTLHSALPDKDFTIFAGLSCRGLAPLRLLCAPACWPSVCRPSGHAAKPRPRPCLGTVPLAGPCGEARRGLSQRESGEHRDQRKARRGGGWQQAAARREGPEEFHFGPLAPGCAGRYTGRLP